MGLRSPLLARSWRALLEHPLTVSMLPHTCDTTGHSRSQSYYPDERHCPMCPKPEEGEEDKRMPRCIRIKTAAGASNTAMAKHWKDDHTEAERRRFMARRSYGVCLDLCVEKP